MTTRPDRELPPRERMVRSAAALLQERGVGGAGMRDVVAHAGAPRGSLQHYFPGGKTQLVAEAVAFAGRVAGAPARSALRHGDDPATMLRRYCDHWRQQFAEYDFARGCPLASTVVDNAATDEVLRTAARDALVGWQAGAAEVLEHHGFAAERAASLATLIVVAIEGAVLLARAERSVRPIDVVEAELLPLLVPPRAG